MSDFSFIKSSSGKFVILAPKRAKRPDQSNGTEPVCHFDDKIEDVLFSLGEVKVVANKYPFAPVHEIIVHSPDHHKNFDELPLNQVEDIIKVYFERFLTHKDEGQVYIFNNHGESAGETLPHPHTQLVVIPSEVKLEIPILSLGSEETKELSWLYIFCPDSSEWPDEVWVAPKREGRSFDSATPEELKELALVLSRLIQIFDLRHGHEFPYNFYIYPGKGWYLRLIPRVKLLGGFEVGTNVFVNTQVPSETFKFVAEHFDSPDFEKIKNQHRTDYGRGV